MLVENWHKIYGKLLGTTKNVYEIGEDSMTIAPNAHTLRLNPVKSGSTTFTVVVTKMEGHIKCGIYWDRQWQPIEIFEISRMDLKRIDWFIEKIAYKIGNHE